MISWCATITCEVYNSFKIRMEIPTLVNNKHFIFYRLNYYKGDLCINATLAFIFTWFLEERERDKVNW